jgi:hypothetical protein
MSDSTVDISSKLIELSDAWHAPDCTADAGGACLLHSEEKEAWIAGYLFRDAEVERLRELAGAEFSVTVRSGDYYVTVDLETAERVKLALSRDEWIEVGARFRRAWSI